MLPCKNWLPAFPPVPTFMPEDSGFNPSCYGDAIGEGAGESNKGISDDATDAPMWQGR